jgi:hypothetical protein
MREAADKQEVHHPNRLLSPGSQKAAGRGGFIDGRCHLKLGI